MPKQITITNIAPYDGAYDLDIFTLTARELEKVKQISGVRLKEISDAINAGDVAFAVALAVVALERAGKYVDQDLLWDNYGLGPDQGKITLDLSGYEDEDDARPPDQKNEPRSSSDEEEKPTSSGPSSANGSESQATVPSSSGTGSSSS